MELESLPEGWEIRSLGEVAEIKAGNPAPQKEKYFENGNIPFVRVQDLGRYGKTSFLTEVKDKVNSVAITECKLKIFPEGTVLLPKSGMSTLLNHRAILAKNACVVSHLAAIIPQKNALSEYLYYFLCTLDSSRIAQRTTLPSIKLKTLSNLEIPLPPLEEQKKIVEILQFADYLKERRREAIKLIDKIVMSLFYDMFGDPATNPKGWEVKKIGDIVKKTQYGISKAMNTEKRGFPILRMDNITYDGHLDIANLKYIEIDRKIAEKYLLNKGDILFNRTNSKELVGKTTTFNIDGEYVFASYLIRLVPDRSIVVPEFISVFLNSRAGKKILFDISRQAIGMANINAQELCSINIPLPPLDLQQEFAEIVSKLEAKRKKMEEAEEKLEMLYQILLRQAFTGKLTEEWR